MLDPGMELLPPLSSPTISSISSSDLDTESTGSFFHDRSTSLGTLMGVASTFPTITFRVPSQRRDGTPAPTTTTSGAASGPWRRRRRNNNNNSSVDLITERRRKRLRRRRWWWLCSGDDLKPSSLGEFLEVERRFGEEALFGGEAVAVGDRNVSEGMLFADGRVLPPQQRMECDGDDGTTSICSFCRFSVSFAGICSGGGG
ncbi:uncharacterized protein At3g17950-like [Rutidosis leptorrhynchoides]|uniref:uncharacterized protein At3g17950-like n=1 Tax=Rutidosis leptorrhynchoides TaxID=125765 RepID=UPI003A991696